MRIRRTFYGIHISGIGAKEFSNELKSAKKPDHTKLKNEAEKYIEYYEKKRNENKNGE